MEVPNRLSLALAEEHSDESVCQKLNEWSSQVEYLCNPRPSFPKEEEVKDSAKAAAATTSCATLAAASSPASTANTSSSGGTTITTATKENDSPQSASAASQVKRGKDEEDPSSSAVVVSDSIYTEQSEEELVVDDDSMVINLSARLHYKMLQSLTPTPSNSITTDHDNDGVDNSIPNSTKATLELAQSQIAAWKASSTSTSSAIVVLSPLLASILRASKNWIRWYLQIYSAQVKRRHGHILATTSSNTSSRDEGNVDNDDDYDTDDPIHRFKSRVMLDFYMDLLHHLIIIVPNNHKQQPPQEVDQQQQQQATNSILARHVALLLFYAMFDPIPPDNNTNSSTMDWQEQQEQQHAKFFQNILNLLIHVDSIPLALALMRNVHNAATVYYYQGCSKKCALLAMARACVTKNLTTSSRTDDCCPVVCPWAPLVPPLQQEIEGEDNNHTARESEDGRQEFTFTYLTLFCNMIAFCLRNQVPTPFPGNNNHSHRSAVTAAAAAAVVAAGGVVGDERSELVCEILRTLYASRIGHEQIAAITRSALDQLDEEEPSQPHLHHLIIELLQLDHDDNDSNINNGSSSSNFDNDQKDRITECQLDTVSLLMDCGPGLMDYVLASQPAVEALLSLLDRQVERVLEQCSTTLKRTKNSGSDGGGDASAMLTPILVVVHRFCQSSPTFRRQAFLSIFPASAEANYQRLVEAQEQLEGENQGDSSAATAAAATPSRGRDGRGGGGIFDKHKMNMSPLDAPVGTKRWRMIQLLTCVPQSSHVKRFTGELLWLLCDENAQDFTHRVGLGNAMPILAVKGFAQLPAHTFS